MLQKAWKSIQNTLPICWAECAENILNFGNLASTSLLPKSCLHPIWAQQPCTNTGGRDMQLSHTNQWPTTMALATFQFQQLRLKRPDLRCIMDQTGLRHSCYFILKVLFAALPPFLGTSVWATNLTSFTEISTQAEKTQKEWKPPKNKHSLGRETLAFFPEWKTLLITS